MNAPTRFPFTASPTSISIFFNGKMHSVPNSDPNFERLQEHLQNEVHEFDVLEQIIDKPKRIARLSEGAVEVVGGTVYYRGEPIHTTLAVKLLYMVDAGFDAAPWARLMERIMANPSDRSRQCLYEFLDKFNAPVTDDGHFIAFKRVRENYFDIHSNTMDNSPGNTVEMPREKVNSNPDQTCSSGLHVAATSYLGVFYASTTGYRVIACKVDPADVVAVPRDYDSAKMRVCRYVVLGDAEEEFYNSAEDMHVYQQDADDIDYDDGIDYDEDLFTDDDICDICGEYDQFDEGLCVDCLDQKEAEEEQEIEDLFNDVDEEDHIAETGLTTAGEPVFERNGARWTKADLESGINQYGSQRAFSRASGIPRSTLQDWLR